MILKGLADVNGFKRFEISVRMGGFGRKISSTFLILTLTIDKTRNFILDLPVTNKNKQHKKMKMSYCLMAMMVVGMVAPLRSPLFKEEIGALKDAGKDVAEHAANELKIAGKDVMDHAGQVLGQQIDHGAIRGHELLADGDARLQDRIGQAGNVIQDGIQGMGQIMQGGIQGLNGAVGNALQGIRGIHNDVRFDLLVGARLAQDVGEVVEKRLRDEYPNVNFPPKAPKQEERQFVDINLEIIKGRLSDVLRIANKRSGQLPNAINSEAGINLTEARKYVLDEGRLEEVSPEDFCRWIGRVEGSVEDWKQSLLVLGICAPWGWEVDNRGILVKQEIELNHWGFLDYLDSVFSEVFKNLYPGGREVPMIRDASSSSRNAPSSSRIQAIEDDAQMGSSRDGAPGSSTDSPTSDIRDDSFLLRGLTSLCMYLRAHRSVNTDAIDLLFTKYEAEVSIDIAKLPWLGMVIDYTQKKRSLADEMRPKVLDELNRRQRHDWLGKADIYIFGDPVAPHSKRIMKEGVIRANEHFSSFLLSKMGKDDAENFKKNVKEPATYRHTKIDPSRSTPYLIRVDTYLETFSSTEHLDGFILNAPDISEQPFSLKDAYKKLLVAPGIGSLSREYLLLSHELAYLNEIVAKAKSPASSREQLQKTIGEAMSMLSNYLQEKNALFQEVLNSTMKHFGIKQESSSTCGITNGEQNKDIYLKFGSSATGKDYSEVLKKLESNQGEDVLNVLSGKQDVHVQDSFLVQFSDSLKLRDTQIGADAFHEVLEITRKIRPTEEQIKKVTAEVDQLVKREVGIANSTFAEMQKQLHSEEKEKAERERVQALEEELQKLKEEKLIAEMERQAQEAERQRIESERLQEEVEGNRMTKEDSREKNRLDMEKLPEVRLRDDLWWI